MALETNKIAGGHWMCWRMKNWPVNPSNRARNPRLFNGLIACSNVLITAYCRIFGSFLQNGQVIVKNLDYKNLNYYFFIHIQRLGLNQGVVFLFI